jgi:hypothetical protein
MFDKTIFRGWTTRHEAPDWEPLKALLPLDLVDGFMWMQADTLDDGAELQAYKHAITRRYLFLDAEARPFEYLGGGRFRRMRRTDALEQSLDMPWVLLHATDAEKALLKEAFTDAVERDSEEADPENQIAPCSPAAAFRWLP